MRTIKIRYVDFWVSCDFENHILTRALRENYDVEIVNDDSADYVFFSVFGDEHWFLPDRCIKIFYTGENVCPDFNACDYGIGFEWLDYGDRYLRFPNYYATKFFERTTRLMEDKHLRPMPEKTEFCSFVVSNPEGNPIRKQLFEEISKYKQVNSGGRWLNNVGGPVADKLEFELKHKFSICCENSSHSGYTTEKLVEAFAAQTVPIYWGDPDVTKIFNPKAFINVTDYNSIEDLKSAIKVIDSDENIYTQMVQEPALNSPDLTLEGQYLVMCNFLKKIVDQPLEKAQRYNREFWGKRISGHQRAIIIRSKRGIMDKVKEMIFRKTFKVVSLCSW